jgi:hypothetical protein
MKLKRQSAAVLLLIGSLCLPALARPDQKNHGHDDRNRIPPGRAQNNAPRPGEWLSKHLNLSPEQQQKDLNTDPEFKRLNPQQQDLLRQRLNQFNSLPPEQKERRLRNLQRMESLPADKQELLRNSLQQFRQLPDDRRRQVRRAWSSLRQMPPEQQDQVLNSDRFRSSFNDQERSTLKGLLDSGFTPETNNGGPPQ